MNNKKTKFIFWLMGLGCGMMVSGIFMLVILLRMPDLIDSTLNGNKQNVVTKKEPEKTPEVLTGSEIPQEKAKVEASEKKTISVTIPKNVNSIAITTLLQQNGVIDDAVSFDQYILRRNQTKLLRAGTWVFPVPGSYEEVLKILLNGN